MKNNVMLCSYSYRAEVAYKRDAYKKIIYFISITYPKLGCPNQIKLSK